MYLLDTCVISEARRGTLPAVKWLQSAQSDTLFMSVITVGEIMKGVMMKLRMIRRPPPRCCGGWTSCASSTLRAYCPSMMRWPPPGGG
jgi:hypothetical protein